MRQAAGGFRWRVLAWLLAAGWLASPAVAQFAPLNITSIPAGHNPMGVAFGGFGNPHSPFYTVAVALADDNAVALFYVSYDGSTAQVSLSSPTMIPVPKPYSVSLCGGVFVVTSPSQNSISIVQVTDINNYYNLEPKLLGTLSVGPAPYAAVCMNDSSVTVLVSTNGDNNLVVVDLASLTVKTRIANVPASRALHGIYLVGTTTAWVAGTDKSLTSIV